MNCFKKKLDKCVIIYVMECVYLTFDHLKSTQAINYLAKKNGGEIDKLRVIKLIFFADRYHLRKYGRLITNDDYVAMKWGPLSSGTSNIIDSNSSFIDADIIDYSSNYLSRDENNVMSLKEVDEDVFSKSDIEALDFAWNEFRQYDQFSLRDLTHKYPEWKKHETAIKSGVKRVPMNLKDFFEEPDQKYNPCYPLNEDEKKYNIKILTERSQVKSAWD